MNVKHMKVDKNEKAEHEPKESVEEPDYPYGMRVSLDEHALNKLGISGSPKVGSKMHMHAHVKVHSSHSHDDGKKTHRNVELQITHMGLKKPAPQSAVEAVDSGIEAADNE